MNEPNASNTFKTNWDRVDRLADCQIDTEDVPPLPDSFFDQAKLLMPKEHKTGRNAGAKVKFPVLIQPDEDGMFIAECPSLPGCISQGMTRDEALTNITDAIQGYIASLEKHDEAVPPAITFFSGG